MDRERGRSCRRNAAGKDGWESGLFDGRQTVRVLAPPLTIPCLSPAEQAVNYIGSGERGVDGNVGAQGAGGTRAGETGRPGQVGGAGGAGHDALEVVLDLATNDAGDVMVITGRVGEETQPPRLLSIPAAPDASVRVEALGGDGGHGGQGGAGGTGARGNRGRNATKSRNGTSGGRGGRGGNGGTGGAAGTLGFGRRSHGAPDCGGELVLVGIIFDYRCVACMCVG